MTILLVIAIAGILWLFVVRRRIKEEDKYPVEREELTDEELGYVNGGVHQKVDITLRNKT